MGVRRCEFCENADLLDGIDSSQFLRSDQSGVLNGDLTVNGFLKVNGNFIQFPTTNFSCNATTAGAVRYDPGLGKLLLCNGTNFEVISSS
ncbi:hypothetical protein [Metabacillus arenae]|uniref:Uncharacterized protein n=1 Tax=Metabacillus arenae TaxID=2771434 RepID=A0A926RWN0_9BACI|nr:hypothetical protein [Metabacillus arenae]MBD1380973.1 hypothetical protein [Metabacillus arenae]